MTRRAAAILADTGPVVVLAGIAAAGSFTHIRDTATGHGQQGWMAWAIAVCIDLTCVMAARERQRDKRTGRRSSGLSWPTVVLVGGILLSLAANLAQAERSVWGWVVAGTPAAAFLVAVSMLERRAAARPAASAVGDVKAVPPSFGAADRPASSPPAPAFDLVPELDHDPVPELVAAPRLVEQAQDEGADLGGLVGQTQIPVPAQNLTDENPDPAPLTAGPLLDFARRVADEHESRHARPITRDALRARLGVSNGLASDLLRQIRTAA
jgi:hypothetical protein